MTEPANTTTFTDIKVTGSYYDADGNAIAAGDLSDLSAAEIALLDTGAAAGTTVASKVVSVDANKMVDTMGVTTEIVRAHNATGSTIVKGALVSFVGVHTDGLPKIVLADANASNLKAQGAAQADILTAEAGTIIIKGLSPATLNTSASSATDAPAYLSETAGDVGYSAETESDEISQIVGYVVVDHATLGQLYYNFEKYTKIGNSELQTGTAYANLGTTATVLELDELDDISSYAQSTIAVAAEAGTDIDVTITLKDAANVAISGARPVRAWLSSSATTGVIATDDTITTTATVGAVLAEVVDDLVLDCVTDVNGVLTLRVAHADNSTAKYLWVMTPGFKKPKVSAVIDHAS